MKKNIMKHMALKLCCSDWDLNPWTSSWDHTSDFKISSFLSHAVVSDSLWPHGLQHTRLPIPSASPGICSNQCPLSWWCHPTISSSAAPFSSCPQSFPASGSFSMRWLFVSSGQSIGALAPVPPMNIQGWFPLGLTGLISFKPVKLVQSCLTLYNPMGHTVHGLLQARILEWVAFLFSRGSSQPWDRTLLTNNSSKHQCMFVSTELLCVTGKKSQRAEWVFWHQERTCWPCLWVGSGGK